jgi:hypothetical protein
MKLQLKQVRIGGINRLVATNPSGPTDARRWCCLLWSSPYTYDEIRPSPAGGTRIDERHSVTGAHE